MKKYDLHKNDFSKLHFEVKALEPYFQRNKYKATKPHRHSFFQILWFKESGNHYIDYNIVEHDANTLFLINKNQVHYFCPDSINSGHLIHFNASFISNSSLDLLNRFELSIFNEIHSPNLSLDKEDARVIDDLSYNLFTELQEKKLNHLQIITHQLISLLYYIERIKKNSGSFNTDIKSGFSEVVAFKQAVFKNIDKNYGVQEYSELVGVSSKKLTTLTKQHTGLTPANLVKDIKILEAKRMLSNQDVSIKEVAYSLGFDQPTYFTKYFKKETQLTPKEFQNSIL